jgi:hypothetical protein
MHMQQKLHKHQPALGRSGNIRRLAEHAGVISAEHLAAEVPGDLNLRLAETAAAGAGMTHAVEQRTRGAPACAGGLFRRHRRR